VNNFFIVMKGLVFILAGKVTIDESKWF